MESSVIGMVDFTPRVPEAYVIRFSPLLLVRQTLAPEGKYGVLATVASTRCLILSAELAASLGARFIALEPKLRLKVFKPTPFIIFWLLNFKKIRVTKKKGIACKKNSRKVASFDPKKKKKTIITDFNSFFK
jgi:hypothetical protein